ncbi:MAG TPA: M28 family metallopeptidase [Archangium sp.]|uniref:M28 family metallopeptidase n=1 Tax=Archangium sp. TaxID=1872627 RepID=UPI002EDB9446
MNTVPEIPGARRALPAAGVWLAAGLVLLLLLWRDRPPAPRPADAPPSEFSEARAMAVVTHLTEGIGLRVGGTEGQRRAAEYLAGTLRALPGVEVEVQTASARMTGSPRGTLVLATHVTNVLARIPGESESAVLLSAHYDSPPESVGAADDAAAVGALVEVARVLSAGPKLRHTLIIGLNGAEEGWLLGSTAFVEHPWARDVRAFINLEAAGARGKATLFQGGPGNKWLTEAYARAAPHPYGTVVGQDLFQSGAIHSETDFRVYRDRGGLTGLDMALFQDGYAYHTALDRVSRLEPGSLQHMGDNTLAVARELASLELPTTSDPEPGVYYDLAGLVMVAYGRSTAGWLSVLAVLLAVAALAVAMRHGGLSARGLATGVAVSVLGLVAGLLLACVLSLVPGLVFHRPHGWFATPWLGVLCYGAAALAGSLGVHALWARSSGEPETRALRAWAGALVLWVGLLGLMTWAGMGSGYVALWWSLATAAGLLVAVLRPAWRGAALLLSFLPGTLVLFQASLMLTVLAVPLSGRLLLPIPFDPVIALLVALPAAGCATLGVVALHRARGLGGMAAAMAVLAVLVLGALVLRFPYSPERPKRLEVVHEQREGQPARVRLLGFDSPDLGHVVAALPAEGWTPSPGEAWYQAFERPAPPAEVPAPVLRVLSSREAEGGREVRLRVEAPGAWEFNLKLPQSRLAGWEYAEPVPPSPDGEEAIFNVHASGDAGWEIVLRLSGAAPVEVECEALMSASTPALEELRGRLPQWTTAFFLVTMSSRARL